MAAEDFKRKLTAVFSADVVGYSRLMGEDETATVKTLETYKGVMFTLIKQHRGRVVDSPGDNLLAEFGSVVDAVQCAVAVQKELQARDSDLPEERKMRFRIGINLGDVIEEKDRLYGDGVNIAARLEALADPGGICVSKTAFDHIESKLPLGYEFLGEQTVKNIAKPVGAYKVLMETRVVGAKEKKATTATPFWRRKAILSVGIVVVLAVIAALVWNFYFRPPPMEVASKEKMAFELPDTPSIAVLPFTNMDNDPKNEFLADGISEGIITALSQVPGMFVIARNSTFTYKGKPVKVQTVSEELGVRYVLEGSVQISGEKLRLNAQLIDALKGHHLWAQRYDRNMKDLFALQDDITMKVISELQIKLTENQQARIGARGTNNLEAYLKYLQGNHHFLRMSPDDLSKARQLMEEAIQLDPNFVMAYSRLEAVYVNSIRVGLIKNPKEAMAMASELAQKALSIDEANPYAIYTLSEVVRYKREWDKAISLSERAVTLSPNDSVMLTGHGLNLTAGGKPEEAIPFFKKALRLDPQNPMRYTLPGLAYRMLKKYDEALPLLEKSLSLAPKNIITLMDLAACYVGVGRLEEAKATVEKVFAIDPKMNVEIWLKRTTNKDQEALKVWGDLLRKAGLPDKPPMKLRDKPSIAVLPFTNMSGDPEQEYFSDGVTEAIIAGLSKVEKLFVIARQSSFVYKGKQVRARQVAEELGVQYLLEGSIQKSGDRVRITAQLIDAQTENHLWSERYDQELKDIFDLQDQIMMKIMTAMRVKLTEGEQARVWGKGTKNIQAYLKLLQGTEYYIKRNPPSNKLARRLFEEVIEIDPGCSVAYAFLGQTYIFERIFRAAMDEKKCLQIAFEMAEKALALDESNPDAHMAMSWTRMHKREYEKALASAERAAALSPNHAFANRRVGSTLIFSGRASEAIPWIEKSIRLNPFDNMAQASLGLAYRTVGQYDEAISILQDVVNKHPNFPQGRWYLIVAYMEAGRAEEARSEVKEFVKIAPNWKIPARKGVSIWKNQDDEDRWFDALRKAGAPG